MIMKKVNKYQLTKYQKAVYWVHFNDEPSLTDLDSLIDKISIRLIAETFDLSPYQVAKHVLLLRLTEGK